MERISPFNFLILFVCAANLSAQVSSIDDFRQHNGKTFLGFWIDNIGCDPVKLSANINGQKTRMRKEINFACGE